MNKNKTNLSVVNAAGIRINSNIIVGDQGSYSSGDILDANATEIAIKSVIGESSLLSEKYTTSPDGELYQIKDNSYYPVSHPDLSTQPSILPQRFGNLDIKEVLIAPGRENEIPKDAIVIEASSFNKNNCVPCRVENKDEESLGIVRDFELPKMIHMLDYCYIRINKKLGLTLGDLLNRPELFFVSDDTNIWISTDRSGHYFLTNGDYNYNQVSFSYDLGFITSICIYAMQATSSKTITDVTFKGKSISFSSDAHAPAPGKLKPWQITNEYDVIPDFTLVRYIGKSDDYYSSR